MKKLDDFNYRIAVADAKGMELLFSSISSPFFCVLERPLRRLNISFYASPVDHIRTNFVNKATMVHSPAKYPGADIFKLPCNLYHK